MSRHEIAPSMPEGARGWADGRAVKPAARRTRVRVTKSPAGDWLWICRIPGHDGTVDPWCTYQMFAFHGGTHGEALAAAIAHHKCHATDGTLTLTYDGFMAVTEDGRA